MAVKDPSSFLSFFLQLEEIYDLAMVTGWAEEFNKRSLSILINKKLPHMAEKWGGKCTKNEASKGTDLKFADFLSFLSYHQKVMDIAVTRPQTSRPMSK